MKLLRNALIYDGTGAAPFSGDILVENDKIVKVEHAIQPEDGWEVVDLDGLSVSSRDGEPDQEKPFGIEKVYINGIKVLDGDILDAEAIRHSGRAMRTIR